MSRFPLQRSGGQVSLLPSMRTALLAATVAVLFAAFSVNAATGAGNSRWLPYLAPAAACPGADDVSIAPRAQKRAMMCLVNWTRGRAGLRRLHWSKTLAYAAGSKADTIARCADFSHHPCGIRWPSIASEKPHYSIFGENLFYASKPIASPRVALLAWLESPEHRAILFGHKWRDLGVTVHPAPVLAGNPRVSIWVLEVAGRV